MNQSYPSREPTDEVLRLLDQHRFHNPLQPKTCYFCKVETFRTSNTPEQQWSRALVRVLKPPTPVGISLLANALLIAAVAALLA